MLCRPPLILLKPKYGTNAIKPLHIKIKRFPFVDSDSSVIRFNSAGKVSMNLKVRVRNWDFEIKLNLMEIMGSGYLRIPRK